MFKIHAKMNALFAVFDGRNVVSAGVGIIANPQSGKDIRRLVAHASSFDNNEKINIVRRALLAMDAVDIGKVWYLPENNQTVLRAAQGIKLSLELIPLPMDVIGNASDSYEAAARMADLGAGAIITLGGDGTNRVVATGCRDVPLVPISTGTNNVFPRMVEGTLAGLAAATIALGVCDDAVEQMPRLDIIIDGAHRDIALIDVVTSPHQWIGARAVWEASHVREIVLSRLAIGEIGMCSIGGMLYPDNAGDTLGAHIVIGDGGAMVLAPLAPGILRKVPISRSTRLLPGETVRLQSGKGTVALDGEREIEILNDETVIDVTFNPQGPRVVSIPRAIQQGANAGLLRWPQTDSAHH